MSMDGEDGRPGLGPGIRDEKVGGYRHCALAVEDDRFAPVPIALDRLERLGGKGDSSRERPEQFEKPLSTPLPPGRNLAWIVLRERILVGRTGEARHPMLPGRVISHGEARQLTGGGGTTSTVSPRSANEAQPLSSA